MFALGQRLCLLSILIGLVAGMGFGRIQAHTDPFITHSDIRYKTITGVPLDLLSLDLYLPPGEGPFPLVIFIHGGSWAFGDKSAVQEKPAFFTSNGYALASINYRLSPWPADLSDQNRITHPIHTQDAASAVAFLQHNAATYGLDIDRIVLLGHSAGGHIAALLGSDTSYLQQAGWEHQEIDCVIGLDGGGYDIPFRLATTDNQFLIASFLNAFTSDVDVQAAASPINHISPENMPKFLLVHQDTDERILINERYHDALLAQDQSVTLFNAAPLDHGEINQLLGASGQNDYNSAVLNFANNCGTVPNAVQLSPTSQTTSSRFVILPVLAVILAVCTLALKETSPSKTTKI